MHWTDGEVTSVCVGPWEQAGECYPSGCIMADCVTGQGHVDR